MCRIPCLSATSRPPQRRTQGVASPRVARGGAGSRARPHRLTAGTAGRFESCEPTGSCEDGRPWCGPLAAARPRSHDLKDGTEELGSEEARARARQGARDDEQGDARSRPLPGHRRQDAFLEHRGCAGRPRPSQGRARGPDPRRPARGAGQAGQGDEEVGGARHPGARGTRSCPRDPRRSRLRRARRHPGRARSRGAQPPAPTGHLQRQRASRPAPPGRRRACPPRRRGPRPGSCCPPDATAARPSGRTDPGAPRRPGAPCRFCRAD